jgi:murein DD-endopeptidase MepM/ murein hydrolase activator NlpD
MTFYNPIRPPVAILKNDKFGVRILNGRKVWHNGVDLRPKSDDILASHGGQVTFAGRDQHGGLYIDITNGSQMTRYLHNRQNLVSRGQIVEAGQLIGYIGATGFTLGGRHLHFETWRNGQRIDPESVVDFSTQPYTKPPIVIEPPVPPQGYQYTVRAGDTLSEIVANHYKLKQWSQIKAKYEEVARFNGIANPNQIFVNQIIILP